MTNLRGWCAAFSFLTLATLAIGDDKQPDDKKFPTDQHKRLDALVGEWDVAVNHKTPDGKYSDGKADCKAKWELNGNALVQKYESDMNGRKFEVVQVLGYDPGKKKFFECFFQNMGPAMHHNEGTMSTDGKTLTFTGEHFDDMTKAMRKMRTVWTFEDKNHFTIEWFMAKPDGGEERGVTLKHTRKKD